MIQNSLQMYWIYSRTKCLLGFFPLLVKWNSQGCLFLNITVECTHLLQIEVECLVFILHCLTMKRNLWLCWSSVWDLWKQCLRKRMHVCGICRCGGPCCVLPTLVCTVRGSSQERGIQKVDHQQELSFAGLEWNLHTHTHTLSCWWAKLSGIPGILCTLASHQQQQQQQQQPPPSWRPCLLWICLSMHALFSELSQVCVCSWSRRVPLSLRKSKLSTQQPQSVVEKPGLWQAHDKSNVWVV